RRVVDAVPRPRRHRGPGRRVAGGAGAHRPAPRHRAWRDQDHRAGGDRVPELRPPLARRAQPRADVEWRAAASLRRLARRTGDVRFGSRPAYRALAGETMEGIRAIPWVFGWTQTRLMLPGWLGVGTALEAVGGEPGGGGLALLRRMAQAWPFFDDLLAKIEMVC